MEKNYTIIFYSKQRILYVFGIPFFFVLFVLVPLMANKLITKEIVIGGLVLLIAAIFIAFFFPKLYAKSIYEAKIDTEGIEFENIKPYLWGKLQDPLRIHFNELKSYKYEPNYNFDMLRLRLKTGKKIKFFQYSLDNNDEFNVFFSDFEKLLKSFNESKEVDNQIKKEKLIMENKVYLWVLAVLITLLVSGSIVLISFKGINNPKGIVSLLITLSPMIWLINQVVKGLRKKSE